MNWFSDESHRDAHDLIDKLEAARGDLEAAAQELLNAAMACGSLAGNLRDDDRTDSDEVSNHVGLVNQAVNRAGDFASDALRRLPD